MLWQELAGVLFGSRRPPHMRACTCGIGNSWAGSSSYLQSSGSGSSSHHTCCRSRNCSESSSLLLSSPPPPPPQPPLLPPVLPPSPPLAAAHTQLGSSARPGPPLATPLLRVAPNAGSGASGARRPLVLGAAAAAGAPLLSWALTADCRAWGNRGR